MKPRNLIEEFLSVKRFAMVGVSRNKNEFSRRLFEEFIRHGYDVIPVNPNAAAIDDIHCFPSVQEVTPHVTSALVLMPRQQVEKILLDCANSGVTLVWMYGISGAGSISPEALRICEEHGIKVVPGYCPLMFMPATAVFHRIHGFFLRAFGKYPR